MFNRAVTRLPDDTDLFQFNKKSFLKDLKDKKGDIQGALSSKEINEMVDAIEGIGHISSKAIDPLMQKYGVKGAAAAGLTFAVGMPLGQTLPALIITNEVLRQAVMTSPGRKIVKYLTQKGQGELGIAELETMLGQVTAALGAGAAAVRQSTNPFRPLGEEQ